MRSAVVVVVVIFKVPVAQFAKKKNKKTKTFKTTVRNQQNFSFDLYKCMISDREHMNK